MSPTTSETVEAPPVYVDPGQVIRVNARFPGSPEVVRFSHLPPRSADAIHDPGAKEVGTLIQRDGDDLYHYSIDTRQMRGGLGWWYFFSEDPDPQKRRAKVGRFVVRDVPAALYSDGETLLGGEPKPTSKVPWVAAGAVAGGVVAGGVIGTLFARRSSSAVIEEVADAALAAVPARLRAADGKFLSLAAPVVETEGSEIVDGEAVSSGMSNAAAWGWIALGVMALGALGVWIWHRHKQAKKNAVIGELPAHMEEDAIEIEVDEHHGFNLLGVD